MPVKVYLGVSADVQNNAKHLVNRIVRLLNLDDNIVNHRLITYNVIFQSLGGYLADWNGISKTDKESVFRDIFQETEGLHERIALIVVQIVLGIKVLSDEDIAKCIIEMTNKTMPIINDDNENVMRRFIDMIKNAITNKITLKISDIALDHTTRAIKMFLLRLLQESGFEVQLDTRQ
jgi:hypothetical protein